MGNSTRTKPWLETHSIKTLLEEHFSVPVLLENEANAGAYGERKHGIGENTEQMVYASIGMGIGIGLIFDGKLYTGSCGFAGELGHMTILKDGITCRCGNPGCWERYASVQALIQQATALNIISTGESAPFERLLGLAEQGGDAATIKLFEQIGDYIGIGLTSCINIFNPDHVVIGNQFVKAGKWIRPAIEYHINSHASGFHQDNLHIHFSQLTSYSTAYRLAAFTIEAFFNEQSQPH